MICCTEELEIELGKVEITGIYRIPERWEPCTSRASEMCTGSSLSLCLSIKFSFYRGTPGSWAKNGRMEDVPVSSSHTGRISLHYGGIQ